MTNHLKYTNTELPIHRLAALVPLAMEKEQIALTNDIKINRQREPIVLWKGAIVDGRCRQKALLTLNYPICYKELDDNLTEKDVRIFVKSINTRRNLTLTQKLTIAAQEYEEGKINLKDAASSWGVGESLLKNTLWLLRNYPNVIEELFNGNNVAIKDQHDKDITSNKITSIYAYYKKKSERVIEDTEHAWIEGARIKTQAGKEWYYSKIKGKNFDIETKQDYEELANYKFPINKKGKQNV